MCFCWLKPGHHCSCFQIWRKRHVIMDVDESRNICMILVPVCFFMFCTPLIFFHLRCSSPFRGNRFITTQTWKYGNVTLMTRHCARPAWVCSWSFISPDRQPWWVVSADVGIDCCRVSSVNYLAPVVFVAAPHHDPRSSQSSRLSNGADEIRLKEPQPHSKVMPLNDLIQRP